MRGEERRKWSRGREEKKGENCVCGRGVFSVCEEQSSKS